MLMASLCIGVLTTGVCEKTCLFIQIYTYVHKHKNSGEMGVNYTMQFIQGNDRYQTFFTTLEQQVSADNPVRLIDAFVDKLDLQKLGFTNTNHKMEGRPPFAPAALLKLYLYGY